MNSYRVDLIDQNEHRQSDYILAWSAQEAADRIRASWKDCCVYRISLVVHDWK